MWRNVTHSPSILFPLHGSVYVPSSRKRLTDEVTEAAISWRLGRHIEIEFFLSQEGESPPHISLYIEHLESRCFKCQHFWLVGIWQRTFIGLFSPSTFYLITGLDMLLGVQEFEKKPGCLLIIGYVRGAQILCARSARWINSVRWLMCSGGSSTYGNCFTSPCLAPEILRCLLYFA